jgi:hypothetical protein
MKVFRWVLLTLLLWGAMHRTPTPPVPPAPPVQTALHAAHSLLETSPLNLPVNFAHLVRGATYTPRTTHAKKANAKRLSLFDGSMKPVADNLLAAAFTDAYIPSLRKRIGETPSSPRDPPIYLRL